MGNLSKIYKHKKVVRFLIEPHDLFSYIITSRG